MHLNTTCTANPIWGDIFESSFKAQSSKLKAWKSLSTETWQKRRSSFELWALKQHSKMSPQVGQAVCLYTTSFYTNRCILLYLDVLPAIYKHNCTYAYKDTKYTSHVCLYTTCMFIHHTFLHCWTYDFIHSRTPLNMYTWTHTKINVYTTCMFMHHIFIS